MPSVTISSPTSITAKLKSVWEKAVPGEPGSPADAFISNQNEVLTRRAAGSQIVNEISDISQKLLSHFFAALKGIAT